MQHAKIAAMSNQAVQTSRGGTVLRFGACELQVLTHELWRDGCKQPIRRRVFDLMMLLIEQRPRTVSHAEIARALWGRSSVRASLLAQVVMQARQLTGDTGDEPAYFVTVRGVGYRFAATVIEGARVDAGTDDAGSSQVRELHATMADATSALDAGDMARAQWLADKALVMANASGVNRERSRALSLASQVAMMQGTLEQAAGLATQALRLADAEGHAHAAAEARVRMARVRMVVGDFHGALMLLEAAYDALDAPDMLAEKTNCEVFFAWAYRELGQFDLALSWCAKSLASAGKCAGRLAGLRERTLEVDLYLTQADALIELGRGTEARHCFERAFALNDGLKDEVTQGNHRYFRMCWLANQSHALGGLDRLDEAWPLADELKAALHAPAGPAEQRKLAILHCLRADLCCRSRRFGEAMEEARQAVRVTEAAGMRSDLPRFLTMTASVHEKAGRFEEAMVWMRRAHAVSATLQMERAASLAQVLNAEAQTDGLRRELDAAREQAKELALENHNLVQRLDQMERARQLDHLGFTDPALLHLTLEPRVADARLRDVPCCLALLVLENHDALLRVLDSSAWNALMRELARALDNLLSPAPETIRWRPGLFVYPLPAMGLRRAREDCLRVEAQLNATPWLKGDAAVVPWAPCWRVTCVDATADATLDRTLARLMEMATQPPASQALP